MTHDLNGLRATALCAGMAVVGAKRGDSRFLRGPDSAEAFSGISKASQPALTSNSLQPFASVQALG